MRIVVSRPTFLSTTNDKPIFDIQAIKDVLLLDGKPWDPTISGEGNMVVSGEYLEIQSYKLNKDSIVSIDADEYNNIKGNAYKLPRSVTLTNTQKPRNLSIYRN